MAMASDSGTSVGTGGMRTKLQAAAKASGAGIPTALFGGRDAATVKALEQGRLRGTLIDVAGNRMQARKYWLRHAPAGSGHIRVDAGAMRALIGGRASLLPGGILDVAGEFHRGDLVEIVNADNRLIARGLCQYGASEVRRLVGRHSRDIESLLGYSYGAEIVHRDDLATVETAQGGMEA
jgi:glutamate 5-kinase